MQGARPGCFLVASLLIECCCAGFLPIEKGQGIRWRPGWWLSPIVFLEDLVRDQTKEINRGLSPIVISYMRRNTPYLIEIRPRRRFTRDYSTELNISLGEPRPAIVT